MSVRLLVGDCRETLRSLPDASVQMVCTSPPYYGLRDYGLPPLVWGGDPEHAHGRGEPRLQRFTAPPGTAKQASNAGALAVVGSSHSCPCGAWLGSLGLEPTPELFLEHLVEVFREVRRVLRPDGVLWLNMGDSYAGSGKGPSNSLQPGASQIGPVERGQMSNRAVSGLRSGAGPVVGYKPKDLMMLPFRVAMALQADGWWLRSVIPWVKRNAMPESVTDRPATACEYVFLLSKSKTYYWDADAVRVAANNPYTPEEYEARLAASAGKSWPSGGITKYAGSEKHDGGRSHPNGRSRRNSDWFFESWQGLLLDEQDDPLALVVNPAPYKGFSESVRRRPVSLDAISDDTKRITSPTCPVHASADSQDSNGRDDERAVASMAQLRTPGSGNHRAQAPLFDSGTTLQLRAEDSLERSPDLLDLSHAPTANDRSNGIHKTDLARSTSPSGSASAETPYRIDDTSTSPEMVGAAERTSESNNEADSSPYAPGSDPSAQTEPSTGGTCTCSYYEEYTERTSHYATFPLKLVEPMVKAGSRPGDTILDPFGGSGTVGVVADRLGRNAILCELSDSYGGQATARVVGDAPLFVEMDGGVDGSTEPVADKQGAVGNRTYTGFNARWDAAERSA